jgi:hypothetical protein
MAHPDPCVRRVLWPHRFFTRNRSAMPALIGYPTGLSKRKAILNHGWHLKNGWRAQL